MSIGSQDKHIDAIMVHGAWHWGECFSKVGQSIERSGIRYEAPDLLSHGSNRFDATTISSMDQYLRPVLDLLMASKEQVVLVGHSLGGVAIEYLASHYRQHISKIIHISGFMTQVNRSTTDIIGDYATNPKAAELFSLISQTEGGIVIDTAAVANLRTAFYGGCSDEDFETAKKHVTPVNTVVPYLWKSESPTAVKRVYVRCTEDRAIPIEAQDEMISHYPDTVVHTLNSGHMPLFSHAEELADILIKEILSARS